MRDRAPALELEGDADAAVDRPHGGGDRDRGADTPGVHDIDTIRTVVSSIGKPFNLVMGFADPTLTVPQISASSM